MKTFLPWFVAVLALGGAWLLHSSSQSKSDELARLQQEIQELKGVREEMAELRASWVPPGEVERLRKDNLDLLRLRNEVQQLRTERQQLTQQATAAQAAAQQAAQQAAAQVQAAQMQLHTLATSVPPATVQMSPEQLAAFQQRYGVEGTTATPEQQHRLLIACVSNLRKIDGAKQQWALENRKTAQDQPTAQDLAPYFRNNAAPICPAGGAYTLNRVAEAPVCSIAGHALPQ